MAANTKNEKISCIRNKANALTEASIPKVQSDRTEQVKERAFKYLEACGLLPVSLCNGLDGAMAVLDRISNH
jgi:hypothetical protein